MIEARFLLYTKAYEKINMDKTIKIGWYARWKSEESTMILTWQRKVIKFNGNEEQAQQLDQLIKEELEQGIIRVINQQEVLLWNRTFAIKKSGGGLRRIMDCRPLNTQLKARYFTMNDLNKILEIWKKNELAYLMDIKSAFNQVAVTGELKKYLAFTHRGIHYTQVGMPFGISIAPRTFSKTIQITIDRVRSKSPVRIVNYAPHNCTCSNNRCALYFTCELPYNTPYASGAYNLGETTEILKPQSQTALQKDSQLLTFCSYLNASVIKYMKMAEYSKGNNENSPNSEIRQEFDSQPLEYVKIQESSIKYDGIEFIYHDNQNGYPYDSELDSYALIQLGFQMIIDLGKLVMFRFVNEVSSAMYNSAIIRHIKIIFVVLLVKTIVSLFLSQRIVNQKYISKEQKKYNYKLVILLLIITYQSIFKVAAYTNYLINLTYDEVGSQNIVVDKPTDEFKVINCTFRNCWNNEVSGGALNIQLSNGGKCWILNSTFINCSSSLGGAIYAEISSGAELTIDGLCSFKDCLAQQSGGGLYSLIAYGVNSKLLLEDGLKFERCKGYYGGGVLQVEEYIFGAITQILKKFNGTLFERCHAGLGGGLYIGLRFENVSLELINLTFIGCHSTTAGGLFIDLFDDAQVTLLGQCLFQDCSKINNASFKNCSGPFSGGGLQARIKSGGQLIIDSCSLIQCNSGNGGGISVQIYDSSQSSFIIKDTLIQKCRAQRGSLTYSQSGFGGGLFIGIYGDYIPASESLNLKGMKIYNNTADKGGQSLFVAMAKVVEWCQYGILGEYVKVNYSDRYSNETDLEGIPMDLETFNTSTSTIIDQQQKPLEHWWRIFGILKSAHVVVNVSNPNGKLIFHLEGLRMIPGYLNTESNEVIYPPEDGSSSPIQIEGEIESEQKASFGKNEYNWLNYKEKLYGVLISNDGNIFTGLKGKVNSAVPLEIITEDEYSFPYWGIILIAVPARVKKRKEKNKNKFS
ncbi:MAG: hypothetical protein EZS28_011165 [Streblomastix strix]|uniref:Reverse transcriptase domain-containing protein n=1 Tax=Streblomastix strix TaxID=222440 RepID=A0A5J4WFM6_9EUKA|nr:MAG: hypothetical protein EZS28_011165 [Streblomastix strix]